jgi:alkanesulfonate monooxygenase SsuD/methylene tetrahydromethanopterin reductase-like flavin-dependent oxidoreductase (luciferase family)
MNYGFVLPFGDANEAAELAYEAEQAGWDGFFVWEPVWGVDAWISLTAAAMRTNRIRLGTMLTPLSRMRPWKLASETATLDRLSNGRVILSVGLGAPDTGFAEFGEVTDKKTRAELLDEGLDILTGLWRGQPFNYQGKHYQIKETSFFPPPPPKQQPRIPVWVVGAWPRMKSMRRAMRYDGLLPNILGEDGQHRPASPEDIRAIKAFIDANRNSDTPYDIIVEGKTPGDNPVQAAVTLLPWAEAGATWWLEADWEALRNEKGQEQILSRIRQGPPPTELSSG